MNDWYVDFENGKWFALNNDLNHTLFTAWYIGSDAFVYGVRYALHDGTFEELEALGF